MTRTIALHSHGGGTGKSHLAVNLGALIAHTGKKVCIVDTDVQSPGLHVLLGVPVDTMEFTLNDYLLGNCEIDQALYDVTDRLHDSIGCADGGQLLLVPCRPNPHEITELLGHGYDPGLLDEALRWLIDNITPDVLVLDTSSAMTNETMVALALADSMTLVMRPDQQDYLGGSATAAVARRLSCPHTVVLVNMVYDGADEEHIRDSARTAFGYDVIALLPYTTDVARLGSAGVFALHHPEHDTTDRYREIVGHLLGA